VPYEVLVAISSSSTAKSSLLPSLAAVAAISNNAAAAAAAAKDKKVAGVPVKRTYKRRMKSREKTDFLGDEEFVHLPFSCPANDKGIEITKFALKDVVNYAKAEDLGMKPKISRLNTLLPQKKRSFRDRHCLMCGTIPGAANKMENNLCKICDKAFWLLRKLNVVIKFCKSCKTFKVLKCFVSNVKGVKCEECRVHSSGDEGGAAGIDGTSPTLRKRPYFDSSGDLDNEGMYESGGAEMMPFSASDEGDFPSKTSNAMLVNKKQRLSSISPLSTIVAHYATSGEFVGKYPGIYAAEKALGVTSVDILQCCKELQSEAGGYTFRAEDRVGGGSGGAHLNSLTKGDDDDEDDMDEDDEEEDDDEEDDIED